MLPQRCCSIVGVNSASLQKITHLSVRRRRGRAAYNAVVYSGDKHNDNKSAKGSSPSGVGGMVDKQLADAQHLVRTSSRKATKAVEAAVAFMEPRERGDWRDWALMCTTTVILVWISAQTYRLFFYMYLHYQQAIGFM